MFSSGKCMSNVVEEGSSKAVKRCCFDQTTLRHMSRMLHLRSTLYVVPPPLRLEKYVVNKQCKKKIFFQVSCNVIDF